MAVFYDPGWPLEDALRPQRLWLLSSQPGAILAAIGLVALVRYVVGLRRHRPRLVRPAIVAVFRRYAATFGRRYASAVVVLVRSYSRNTGRVS